MADLSVTADDVIRWSLGWPTAKIRKRMGGRERWTAFDLIESHDLTRAPVSELAIYVLHPSLVSDRTLWCIACDLMDLAACSLKERGVELDPRSAEAVRARRRWLQGHPVCFLPFLEAAEEAADKAATAARQARAKQRATMESLMKSLMDPRVGSGLSRDPQEAAKAFEAAKTVSTLEDAAAVTEIAITLVEGPHLWARESAIDAVHAAEYASDCSSHVSLRMLDIIRDAIKAEAGASHN